MGLRKASNRREKQQKRERNWKGNGREVLWRERKRNASAAGAALPGADVGNVHTG